MKKQTPEVDPRLMVQSVARAMRVQEAVGQATRPLSLAEIARAAEIDRSAAQRFAYTLEALGYLERGESGQGYRPGLKALDRSFEYLRAHPLVERATPALIELRKETRERVDLSLFDGASIVYAIRLQSKRETFYATLVGRRIPTFCTAGGRAMLALLDDSEIEDILDRSDLSRLTPKTITDRGEIMDKIKQARSDGYALALEEGQMGEIVIGTAIRGAQGRPLAAIHIAGSLSEWQERDFRDRCAPLAMEAAAALHIEA
ncbi:helix-turn-helix domain-containing protein [Rhodobacteraceae bacterium D3-12]|nr:helix-turn-helix domain-containing protein [Rhodobacteraceae bacterium D3-12]